MNEGPVRVRVRQKVASAQNGTRPASPASEAAASPAGVDLGELDGYIGFNLRIAQDASFRSFTREAGQQGLEPGQFAALAIIGHNPGIGQGELGQAIARDKSSITPVVQKLQRLGLIERRQSEEDKRRIHLYLTGPGKERLAQLSRHAEAHDRKLDEIVGDAKPKFLELLKSIADALG